MSMNSFHAPPLTAFNKALLILVSALFLLDSVLQLSFSFSLAPYLGLSLTAIQSGWLTQLLTYPLLQTGLMGLLFNGLCLWFLGGELELTWGRKFYLKYIFICYFFSGLIFLTINYFFFAGHLQASWPLLGLSGVTFSLLVAYGLLFSERYLSFMFLFPIKAKYFCLLLGAVEAYQAFFSTFGRTSWAHLFSMMIGFLYLQSPQLKQKIKSMGGQKKKRTRTHLKIVDLEKGPDDKPRYWH